MRKRRLKGEGGISEYRKGHWRAYLDLGKDPETGKRIRKTFTGSSKQEVVAKLNKAKYEKQEGLLTITPKTPIRLYYKHWLAIKKPNVRESTYEIYKYIMEDYIVPYFGDKAMSEVTLLDINKFFSGLDIASSSKQRIKTQLANLFKQACKEQLIANNIVTLVDPIHVSQRQIEPLTIKEIDTLLDTAKKTSPFYYVLIKFTIETGLRRGEVLGLHWSDIDFEKDTISIKRNVHVVGNEQVVDEPKTEKSKRTISVSPSLLKELKDTIPVRSEVVFSNPNGGYLLARHMYRCFKDIVKLSGLRGDIRFHDLRHTHATLLIAKGVNMKTVSERLGHSSITITMDRYAHGVQEEDKKAAELLDTLITK